MNILLKKSANTSFELIITFDRKHVGQTDKMYLKVEIPDYVSKDFELCRSLGRKVHFFYSALGFLLFYVIRDFSSIFRACSHELRPVNYPGVMIALGQALPRVHMMICCPGPMLPRVNFIALGQAHRHLITTNLSEFL